MASRTTNGPAGNTTDIPRALAAQIQSPPSSLPVEMSSLGQHAKADSSLTDSSPSTLAISPGFLRSSRDGEGHDVSSATPDSEQAPQVQGPVASPPPVTLQTTPSASLTPLTHEKTAPAIGPSSDTPTSLPKHSDTTGPQLMITLLLINGARHPYKIDEKYLKKRSVSVEDNNPINLSTYTLKELIWREWREGKRPDSESWWVYVNTRTCRLGGTAFEPKLYTSHLLRETVGR